MMVGSPRPKSVRRTNCTRNVLMLTQLYSMLVLREPSAKTNHNLPITELEIEAIMPRALLLCSRNLKMQLDWKVKESHLPLVKKKRRMR